MNFADVALSSFDNKELLAQFNRAMGCQLTAANRAELERIVDAIGYLTNGENPDVVRFAQFVDERVYSVCLARFLRGAVESTVIRGDSTSIPAGILA